MRTSDVELVAEFADVMRSTGMTELDDEEICEATLRLLAAQEEDGSWPPRVTDPDAYDSIHPTWTAIGALRSRVFLTDTPYERRRRLILAEAVAKAR